MQFKTHLALGVLTGMLTTSDTMQFCCICVGSILPDIDHSATMLGKAIPIVPKLFKHRGFTHSLLFSTIIAFVDVWMCYGTLIHCISDMMTKQGISLLYPIERKIRLPLAKYAKTGGAFEKFFFFLINIAILTMLYIRISENYPNYLN